MKKNNPGSNRIGSDTRRSNERRKQTARQLNNPEKRTTESEGGFQSRIPSFSFSGILKLVGFFGGPTALVTVYFYTIPSTNALPDETGNVLDLPFVGTNESHRFDMYNVRAECIADHVVFSSGIRASDLGARDSPGRQFIPANSDADFKCALGTIVGFGSIISGQITLRVYYRTNLGLHIPRRPKDSIYSVIQVGDGYRWITGRMEH